MFKKGNNFDRVKQRFSLRKLNIGVCSVLLGLTFMSGNNKTVKPKIRLSLKSRKPQFKVRLDLHIHKE
ncbi:YSIRK-type signal peptide-containing protein [Lactobacillus amylovorus]|nr:YSIRK-type signal peptide-containing protein [Lactobacillus amylovorus]